MRTSAAPSTALASPRCRELLAASFAIAQRLEDALAPPPLLIWHRSQWRCLAASYSAVIQNLIVLLDHACCSLEPPEQEIMCGRLTRPLDALYWAVQEGAEVCMQEYTLPSSPECTHLWLVERLLKLGMGTDVVDIHLHRLLWTSSVVREQILKSAQNIEEAALAISEETWDLFKIWADLDAKNDFLSALSILDGIIRKGEGEPRQLATFIQQKLSYFDKRGRITDNTDLPPFLWVNPEDLSKNPELLGHGGYGTVHEASWLGGRFAVKDFFYVECDVVFGREAIIQAHLQHPNVIPLVCCAKNPSMNKCSLVMELMQQDLQILMVQRIEAGIDPPFPLLIAVDLMLQIAQGMEYLHGNNLHIIHRDLKSSNILVSFSKRCSGIDTSCTNDSRPHMHLKIADFGMAKAKIASSRYTTRPRGTTAWRAPEVFEANPEDEVEGSRADARYTNKADVYSFGLVCYEILTGKIPFKGPHIRRRVLAGERPMMPAHCPLALSSYIERCWHAEPVKRPTFTQICTMLRYLKACIFLEDHFHNQIAREYHDSWLLHSLSPTMCARIDDVLQSLVEQFASVSQELFHLLVIPLEMYSCNKVLKQLQDEVEVHSNQPDRVLPQKYGGDNEVHTNMQGDVSESSSHVVARSVAVREDSSTRLPVGKAWVVPTKSMQKAKSYFDGGLKWLKKIKSELQYAGSLVGDFTYEELCLATDDFTMCRHGGPRKVFLGTLADGRSISVKIVPNWQGLNPEDLRIASQLRHQNIVSLYGWCQHRGDLLLVYDEYMANADLGMHIHGGSILQGPTFGWTQRYKVVCQVAAALKYLHEDSGHKQIVHQNVNPCNIFLDSKGNARLAVQGLLEERSPCVDGSGSPTAGGTLGYIVPELLLGKGIVSPAADIFSFGVMVLVIVSGKVVQFRQGRSECTDHLVGWVCELYRRGEVLQAADVRLGGNFDSRDMKRVLMLGMACSNQRPEDRPSIQEVLKVLWGATEPDHRRLLHRAALNI